MNWLENIPAWVSFGIGASGGGIAFWKVLDWFGGRLDVKAASIDAGTKELIEQLQAGLKQMIAREEKLLARVGTLEEEIQRLRHELNRCKEEHGNARAEIAQLRATMQGYGDARQSAQRIIAYEKKEQSAQT